MGNFNGSQRQVDTSLLSQYAGSTCELDSRAGLYNPYAMAGIRRAGMGEKTVLDG